MRGKSAKGLLPPNQQLVAPGKWPLVGEREPDPCRRGEAWKVSVSGLVARPHTWTLEELCLMPQVEQRVDLHCVTRWSKLGVSLRGVPLRHLLDLCQPLPHARFLSFKARSSRGHSTSLPLGDALALGTLVVLSREGKPLPQEHGGPVRIVVPERYFYKSLKWLEEIRVLEEDELGFWEREAGYHNRADPWREERYVLSSLDRQEYRRLLARRDFSERDLLGVRAMGLNLCGLQARGAKLRDAHFERAILEGACFDGANLSNAHFEGASLCGATFGSYRGQRADLEGANFRGADLRGVDFRGASLLGVTFCPQDQEDPWGPAILDSTARLDQGALEQLTPLQLGFVLKALKLPEP